VKNDGGHHNGITVSDMSTYNTFNNCSAIGNTGTGIATFGNWNTGNTFNNCTSMYNTGTAFGQSRDAFNNYGDSHTTIHGGMYCCNRSPQSAVLCRSIPTLSS
jgi:hypothetical protein